MLQLELFRHHVQPAEGSLDRNTWIFGSDILLGVVLEDVKALLGDHLVRLLAPFFIHSSYGGGAFPTITGPVICSS